jgi:hypothetical protein
METKISQINDLFKLGMIDAETRDRAIAKANEDALGGKGSHAAEGVAATESNSSAALSNIFAAMRSGGANTGIDRVANAVEKQLENDEEMKDIEERVAKAVEKFGTVEFGVGAV